MLNFFIKRLRNLSIYEIFILISMAVFTVFIVKYFGQKVDWKIVRIEIINKSWSENYNPYGYRTPFWLSDKLKVGQIEYDKSGQNIAEIIGIENYERGSEEAEVYLTVKLRTTYLKRLHQHFFKEKPLNLGSAIEISPSQNIVYGQLIDIDVPASGYPQKSFIVTARGRGLESSVSSNIKINESMSERVTKSPVATILDFHTEPTTRVYVNEISESNKYLGFKVSPTIKDVVIKFKVNAHQIDNRWYFAGHQNLKIANSMYFYGQNINLYNLEIETIE